MAVVAKIIILNINVCRIPTDRTPPACPEHQARGQVGVAPADSVQSPQPGNGIARWPMSLQ